MTRGLTYLLAAVESLTFLPSKEAKCCSRASRRLLGACRDRKHTVSNFLRGRKCRLHGHQDHKGQWWATKMEQRSQRKCTRRPIDILDWEVKFCLVTHHWLIDDCIPAKKLLWMRVTSVWDDVLHHGSFNNLQRCWTGPCLSTTGQPLYRRWATLVHTSITNNVTKVNRIYHSECFFL